MTSTAGVASHTSPFTNDRAWHVPSTNCAECGRLGWALACECSPSSHWHEDAYGDERRIVCDCPCTECAEY